MEVDSDVLLEWLTGRGLRDMQEMALEQFCGILLMAESIDPCIRLLPPQKFVPALCGIFLDQTASDSILEIAARAITYYLELEVSRVTHYITKEIEPIRAICNKLVISSDYTNKALVEQCIKVLEYICIHIPRVVFEVGGFNSILAFIRNQGEIVHRDTLHSAISAISSSCRYIDSMEFQNQVCMQDLTALLEHEDERVANGALISFHLVAMKFEADRMDPTQIAKHGLIKGLMVRLNTTSAASPQGTASNAVNPNSKTISIIFKILTIFCRSSSSITKELLQSDFLDVIEKVFKLNESSVLDAIKFVDTLLELICSSREKPEEEGIARLESLEDLFPDIIECLRMNDFESFVDLLETKRFDLDYTDSFGQTLMNWTSAIGTAEMVHFLCRKHADVQKGEHGSSLHYAASAGKLETVKVLLRYGADKGAQDENGKFPLNRAQEGTTDAHKEVVDVLSYHYLMPERKKTKPEAKTEREDNLEMVPVYLQRLLPIFFTTFQSTTIDSVRKATLMSIKSVVKYMNADTLKELCSSDVGSSNFAYHIAESIASILHEEENDKYQLIGLKVIQYLLKKCEELFVDVFARLGIFFQMQHLAQSKALAVEEAAVETAADTPQDAEEILPETAYHWRHWCVCLCSSGFYVWSESVTLEFCNNSNGWFGSFINGKLDPRYSSGRVKDGSSQNALSFLIKFDAARRAVNNASASIPILSNPGTTTLLINNWSIVSPVESELHILNLENPQQKITLSINVHNFLHESDSGSIFSFTSKKCIAPTVAGGWLKYHHNSKLPTIQEEMRKRIVRSANSIYEKYFKTAHVQTRPAMVKLKNAVVQIKQSPDVNLKEALDELTQALTDNEAINAYELENSGLIQALLLLFEQKRHIQLFRQCFEEKSTHGNNMFEVLVQKLIAVLENTEKLPVYSYNAGQSLEGINILQNTFRIRLRRGTGESHLINRTDEPFQVEPLSTVKELEEFLLKMVIVRNTSNAASASREANSNVLESVSNPAPESAAASVSDALPELATALASDAELEAVSASDVSPELAVVSVSDASPDLAAVSASDASQELAAVSTSDIVPESASDIVPESAVVSTSNTVPESASDVVPESVSEAELDNGSLQFAVESVVLSEIVNLDTAASAVASGSEEVVDLDIVQTVTAEEMAIAYGTRSVPESAVASGSGLVSVNTPESTDQRQTILERILTTNTTGESSGTSSKSQIKDRNADSGDSSDEDSNGAMKWNKKFVLKRQFPALVLGYDPRPEHFVSPTTDFEILPPDVEEFTITSKDDSKPRRRLKLILKTNTSNYIRIPVELELTDSNYTIFRALRELIQLTKLDQDRQVSQLWSNYYRIVYSEVKDDDLPPKPSPSPSNSKIYDVLELLKRLFVITTSKEVSSTLALTADQFSCKKINIKLLQQMKDILIVSSSCTPAWCEEFIRSYSFLFPFETRQLYFQITAFGTARTVMWFQEQEMMAAERARTNNTQQGGYRLNSQFGRLKTERIQVPRGPSFLEWAMQVLKTHCDRKAKLEIQFIDEEGTGLGPTLEFYTLTATKLQQRDLAMWICDDFHLVDVEGSKATSYYVRNQSGLFPAPLPQDSKLCDQVVKYFWVLGVLLAKVLQDNRLVDLPLSKSFLKLMCRSNTGTSVNEEKPWYQGVLGLHDLYDIDPVRAEFLNEIRKLVIQKTAILQDATLCSDSKASQIQNLQVTYTSGPISLEDLALNFTYAPSSKIFGFSAMELVPNGADIEVTIENVEEYSNLTLSFALEKGIARQLEAFHQGFSEVFPMEKLAAFSQNELRKMLCGDQNPQWTKEDLINYTEPKLGYTKESPGFLRFVNVLMDISPEEKKAFVQFATGCSSLPPGGLANLIPRLTVVKKVDAGEGSYPSVNTCVHYLKLPEYSTEEILKERLLIAIKQTGFHFN